MQQPAPSHSADYEELAALSALGVLEGDELAAYEAHRDACSTCRGIEAADRATLDRLAAAAPERAASDQFRERLMAAAVAATETAPEVRASLLATAAAELPGRRPTSISTFRRGARWLLPLAAALLLVLSYGARELAVQYGRQVVATVALPATGATAGAASVALHRSGAAELRLEGLPEPPPGQVYEAWLIEPGQAPVPAGTVASGSGAIGLSDAVRGKTVAVTLEAAPGAPAPSGSPLFAGPVGA